VFRGAHCQEAAGWTKPGRVALVNDTRDRSWGRNRERQQVLGGVGPGCCSSRAHAADPAETVRRTWRPVASQAQAREGGQATVGGWDTGVAGRHRAGHPSAGHRTEGAKGPGRMAPAGHSYPGPNGFGRPFGASGLPSRPATAGSGYGWPSGQKRVHRPWGETGQESDYDLSRSVNNTPS